MRKLIPFITLSALLLGCGDEPTGSARSTSTGDAAQRLSTEEAPAVPLDDLAAGVESAARSCDIDTAAESTRLLADRLGEDPAGTVAGMDAARWRARADALETAGAAAKDGATFATYWREKGYDPDPSNYHEVLARLERGDPAAIAQTLAEREGYGLGSMLSSALHAAYEAGHDDAQAALLTAILDAQLPFRDRIAAIGYLRALGRTEEADKLLDEVRSKGEPVALGSSSAGLIMTQLIDQRGVDEGIAEFRQVFGEQAMGMALLGTVAEYERASAEEAASAFLSSAAVQELLRGDPMEVATDIGWLSADLERTMGSESFARFIGDTGTRLAESGDSRSAMLFSRLAEGVAENGCSAACLEALVAAARARVESTNDGEWRQALAIAYGAAGQLDQALTHANDIAGLSDAAVGYALTHDQMAYVDQLIDAASESQVRDIAARYAAKAYWNDAPMEAVAHALAQIPSGESLPDWLTYLTAYAAYGATDTDRRRELRLLLAAWAEGACGEYQAD